jgi:hypothetical protein
MTERDVMKEIAKTHREVADKLDAALDAVSKPPEPETSEAAQEAHESELRDFNTIGGVSLNSATPKSVLEDLLKKKTKE